MLSAEARPLDAAVYTRKCVVTRLKEFSISKFKEIVQQNAGGILILLPNNLTGIGKDEKVVRRFCWIYFSEMQP